MFFSLSFCITCERKGKVLISFCWQNLCRYKDRSFTFNIFKGLVSYTNLCHGHLKVLLGDVDSPFSQSVHPCLSAHTLKNPSEKMG